MYDEEKLEAIAYFLEDVASMSMESTNARIAMRTTARKHAVELREIATHARAWSDIEGEW